jgi:peptidoglycan/xylan/chitin deacetylase (PgdA/CDA1 family)
MKPLSPWVASFLRRSAAGLEFPKRRRSLLVLMFHRVLPQPDPLLPDEPDVAAFAAEIDVVRSIFSVLPLAEAIERLYSGSLPPNAACITLDDGYANNLTCAAPILEARGVPATVFIATGFLDGGRMWNDTVIESIRRAGSELDLSGIGLGRFELPDATSRRSAARALIGSLKYLRIEDRERTVRSIAEIVGQELPRDLMLSETQVKEIVRRGVDVAAHTVSHAILTRVDEATARREISVSKSTLENLTGGPVRLFAYPNGHPGQDYLPMHVKIVREAGFIGAVSTVWGACHRGSDRYQLPRLRPCESSALRFAARLLYARREREDVAG